MNKKDNLLICTQAIDANSTTLGFMVSWVREISKYYNKVTVICLYKGDFVLPDHVEIISLGKENSRNRFKYIFKIYKTIFSKRNDYNKVFIHMNDEYGLMGGLPWKLMGKTVSLWSNHYYGTWKRDLVGKFCDKIFYTSQFSYTANKAKFPQAIRMPVGVDISNFSSFSSVAKTIERKQNSILFLARLDPSKKPDIVLHAIKNLKDKNIPVTATFVGGANPDKFAEYEKSIYKLKETLGLGEEVVFVGPVPGTETPRYYLSHSIYVNVAKSGMLDKTIFESVVGGCLPLTTSVDFNEMIFSAVGNSYKVEEDSVDSLTRVLEQALSLSGESLQESVKSIQKTILQKHSLEALAKKLSEEI